MPQTVPPEMTEPEARLSALGKGLSLLRVMSHSSSAMSPGTLANELSLSVPTTHRVLAELEAHGWVGRDAGGRDFTIGPEFLLIAATIASRDGFFAGLRALLRDMVGEVGETACLNMIDRRIGQLVVVAVEEPPRPLSYRLLPGDVSPLHAGASGKAALASMTDAEIEALITERGLAPVTGSTITDPDALKAQIAQIRSAGYAVSKGERLAGSVGIAAPVRAQNGRVYGSLLLTVPEFRFSPDDEARLAAMVVTYAERLSRLLVPHTP